MVIDADAHANEPVDLFDRYLEKEYKDRGLRSSRFAVGHTFGWWKENFPASGGKLGSWNAEMGMSTWAALIWRSRHGTRRCSGPVERYE